MNKKKIGAVLLVVVLWLLSLAAVWWFASNSIERSREEVVDNAVTIANKVVEGKANEVYSSAHSSFRDLVTEEEFNKSFESINNDKLKLGTINEAYIGYTENLVQYDLVDETDNSKGTLSIFLISSEEGSGYQIKDIFIN